MRLQALLFDLDDTLMDTNGQLVMEAHHQACRAMLNAGLNVPLDLLFERRQALLIEEPRQEINALLAADFGCQDEQIIQAGYRTFFNPEISVLYPFEGVRDMLNTLCQDYTLFLVTSGYQATQERKVAALEIASYFEEICYPSIQNPQGKHQAFLYLQNKYAYAPEEMVVIGDRITNEIVAGNRLGYHTIWIQQGECAHILPQSPDEQPSLCAQHVCDVPQLLQSLKKVNER